jgi:hypothetical protein
MRGILPVLLVAFGVYLLRDYVFKPRKSEQNRADYEPRTNAPMFAAAYGNANFRRDGYNAQNDLETETRVSTWKNRA